MPNGVRKNVPILAVGEEWHASTGTVTFTPEHLAAAVAAQDDVAVRDGVIKLGHVSLLNQGEPALGRVTNLHLSPDGMTLLADFEGLPQWLDDGMPTLYPRRSSEGTFNMKTNTGKSHLFAITAVALLGTQYPAITTLEDIPLLISAQSLDDFPNVVEDEDFVAAALDLPEDTVQGAEKGPDLPMAPRKKSQQVAASVAVDDVRRQYYDDLDPDDYFSQWIRQIYVDPPQLIVSDDRIEPYFLQIPYTADATGDTVTFGEPVKVRQVFEPVSSDVAASLGNDSNVISYSTPDESRPAKDSNRSNDPIQLSEAKPMTPEDLKTIGLAEDATPEQISAKLAELAAAASDVPAPEGEVTETTPTETETATPPGSAPVVVPQQKDGEVVETPETVTVDAAAWSEAQAELGRLREMRLAAESRENDAFIAAALKDGRITPASRDSWRTALNGAQAAEVKATISSFPKSSAANVVETGHSGHGEDVSASQAEEYPAEWGGLLNVRKANA